MNREDNIQVSLYVFLKRIGKYDEWIEFLKGDETPPGVLVIEGEEE